MRSIFKTTHSIQNVLIAISFLSLVACHSGQSPSAPDLSVEAPEIGSSPSSLRIALTPFGLRKSAGEQTSSDTKTKGIGKKGGKITITHEKTRALFVVPKNALNKRTQISMQVHGSGAATVVEFGPDGLHFEKPAYLALSFSSEDVDPESLGGYLVEEDGTRTPVRYRVRVKGDRITLLMQIAHFSIYTGNDGEESDDDWWDEIDEDPANNP